MYIMYFTSGNNFFLDKTMILPTIFDIRAKKLNFVVKYARFMEFGFPRSFWLSRDQANNFLSIVCSEKLCALTLYNLCER